VTTFLGDIEGSGLSSKPRDRERGGGKGGARLKMRNGMEKAHMMDFKVEPWLMMVGESLKLCEKGR
jgi:hypothetical protein